MTECIGLYTMVTKASGLPSPSSSCSRRFLVSWANQYMRTNTNLRASRTILAFRSFNIFSLSLAVVAQLCKLSGCVSLPLPLMSASIRDCRPYFAIRFCAFVYSPVDVAGREEVVGAGVSGNRPGGGCTTITMTIMKPNLKSTCLDVHLATFRLSRSSQ